MTTKTAKDPKTGHLLTAENSALALIDFQPGLVDGTWSISRESLVNNVVALAKAAKMFDLPVVLSTIGVNAGYQEDTIDRTKVNAWEEDAFREAVEATGRRKIIMAALWTDVCLVFPALDMLRDGYEIYAVSDASGGTSVDAHQRGMERVVQAGAAPVTWEAVMAELARLYQGDYVGNFVEIMQDHLPKSG